MSLVIESIIEKSKDIPIVFNGEKKRLSDLGKGRYEAIVRSLRGEGDIYLGEKTKQGIGIYLFNMELFDEKLLKLYGYEIQIKNLKQEKI